MAIIVVSCLFLIAGFFIAFRSLGEGYRASFGISVFVWGAFLLFIYTDALLRITASTPPAELVGSGDFVKGLVAYKHALSEFKIAMALLMFVQVG